MQLSNDNDTTTPTKRNDRERESKREAKRIARVQQKRELKWSILEVNNREKKQWNKYNPFSREAEANQKREKIIPLYKVYCGRGIYDLIRFLWFQRVAG